MFLYSAYVILHLKFKISLRNMTRDLRAHRLFYEIAHCWEIRGPPPRRPPCSTRVVAAEENTEQGKNKRIKLERSKHSRFTWFGLRAYVHGGKGESIHFLSNEITYYKGIGTLL